MKTVPFPRRVTCHSDGRPLVRESGVVGFEDGTILPWAPPSTGRSGG